MIKNGRWDIRLKHCTRDSPNPSLIEIDHHQVHNIVLPGDLSIPNVPQSIKCDKGERISFRSDALSFQQINAMCKDMMQQLKVSRVKQLARQQADGITHQREAGYVDHVKSTVQSSCKHTIHAHEGGCGSILFQHNSDELISGGQDRTVKIWDTKLHTSQLPWIGT